MMLRSSLFCGLLQRYWFQSEGERTRNSSATCLMFGHLVRAKEISLQNCKSHFRSHMS